MEWLVPPCLTVPTTYEYKQGIRQIRRMRPIRARADRMREKTVRVLGAGSRSVELRKLAETNCAGTPRRPTPRMATPRMTTPRMTTRVTVDTSTGRRSLAGGSMTFLLRYRAAIRGCQGGQHRLMHHRTRAISWASSGVWSLSRESFHFTLENQKDR